MRKQLRSVRRTAHSNTLTWDSWLGTSVGKAVLCKLLSSLDFGVGVFHGFLLINFIEDELMWRTKPLTPQPVDCWARRLEGGKHAERRFRLMSAWGDFNYSSGPSAFRSLESVNQQEKGNANFLWLIVRSESTQNAHSSYSQYDCRQVQRTSQWSCGKLRYCRPICKLNRTSTIHRRNWVLLQPVCNLPKSRKFFNFVLLWWPNKRPQLCMI